MPAKRLPTYRSHKEVVALRIKAIFHRPDGSATLEPVEDGHKPVEVTAHYMIKHEPEVGGFWVCYEDGYESFSPAVAFLSGYKRVDSV